MASTLLLMLALALVPVGRDATAGPKPLDPSGGRAVAHHAEGKPIKDPAVTARAPEADLYNVGVDALEPTLGITKKDDVFYAAANGTRNEVMLSSDGGKKWKPVSPQFGGRNVHAVSLDPYVWVDEDTGRVYTIDLTVACSLMSFSDDRGKSWTTNPLACGRPVNDHQTLFGGPPVSSSTVGYPNLIYYCWNDVATSSCGKSLDGGLTWHATGSPVFHAGDGTEEQGVPNPDCGGLHGHGVVGRDGAIYLPKEHCLRPFLAISRDEGLTWERVRVSKKPVIWGPDPSVAVDNKGNIYYLFISRNRLPYLTYSRDGGKKWAEPMMVGMPGITETALATLDVGAPGKVGIVYYGTDDVDGPVDEREYPNEVMWDGFMTMSANVFDEKPVFYSGTINDPKDPMARGACGPRRCYDALDFIDVVVGFDGTPWTSLTDNCISVCAGPAAAALVHPTGVVGRFVGGPSLR
ncbi:MAG TPA: sialidase family protein [Actinomycetota bacterium]|nr:sialidase family protein [Actinomycetota bacterium]